MRDLVLRLRPSSATLTAYHLEGLAQDCLLKNGGIAPIPHS